MVQNTLKLGAERALKMQCGRIKGKEVFSQWKYETIHFEVSSLLVKESWQQSFEGVLCPPPPRKRVIVKGEGKEPLKIEKTLLISFFINTITLPLIQVRHLSHYQASLIFFLLLLHQLQPISFYSKAIVNACCTVFSLVYVLET